MKVDGKELEQMKQDAKDTLLLGEDLTDLVEEIYNNESNFNNCDKSSGQRVWTYDEIHDAVFSVLEE